MRVIAGEAKGTRLLSPPKGVRPIADRAKEGLFSSLGDRVEGARVLDLYAGSGAIGIEALSRGAAEAVFVEASAPAARVIGENLERARLSAAGRVIRTRAQAFSRRGSDDIDPFDLLFLDPPYDLGGSELEGVLLALAETGKLAGGWTLALTRGRRSSTHVIPVDWAVARRLRYGDSFVVLYREV